MSGAHSDAIIFNLYRQQPVMKPAAQVNGSAVDLRGESVLDGVLDQRLQEHAGDDGIERRFVEILDHAQLVAPEAHNLDVEVVVDELELLAQLDEGVAFAQQPPQNVGEFYDDLARGIGIEAHQR